MDILLVEDKEAHVELIRRGFESQAGGMSLHVARSLGEARAHIARSPPSLIIADLRLPDGEGIELLPADREAAAYPVVVMTSQGDEQTAVEAMKAGALDYVVKSREMLAAMPRIAERALREWGHLLERKRMERALQESEERHRTLLQHLPVGVFRITPEGRFLEANAATARLFGIEDVAALRQHNVKDFFLDLSDHACYVEQLKREGTVIAEHRMRRVGGEMIWVRDYTRAIRDDRGEVAYFDGILVDITERTRMRKEILEISNFEQRRIGQDLHDSVGQLLTGAGLYVAAMEQQLLKKGSPEATQAAEIGEVIEEALTQTRMLARGLSPIRMGSNGLRTALKDLTRGMERIYGVRCPLSCPFNVFVEDLEVATHVYRIAQEALNNAMKHGRASRIEVTLAHRNGTMTLTVKDNGRGVPEPNECLEGMGLCIMKYRARMIHGILEVRRGTEGGTVVTCEFPTNAAQQKVLNASFREGEEPDGAAVMTSL